MKCSVAVFLVAVSGGSIIAAPPAPEGEFQNDACMACHQKQDAELVAAWRDSAHATAEKAATCVTCHGKRHENAALRARQDPTCIDCHGGERAPVVHSYTTSKHGVLTRLEQHEWDWEQPLDAANYRAPGCAYCHMHRGNHNVSASVAAWNPTKGSSAAERERVQDVMRAVCQECHSTRYITRLFENGERMLQIGRMKVHEAARALEEAQGTLTGPELAPAQEYFRRMQALHLKNVYLGVGHQSPDYQWWHGQPALDGDLLRIKGALSELRRSPARDGGKDGG